ncbi:hypothetical protein LTR36_004747 [Oleoguttula mirabilis]|uniref:non-specific serine/threonine protein kinase n=1 Tax=Oleoguttula mirabilis TaxID=1507867 RepID=A0AAV9JGN1_9PEZI|nr:hypothetical protein LTR36_004747 [Oleoguttula mirabilis]
MADILDTGTEAQDCQRFIDFALLLVDDDDKRKETLHQTLTTEWTAQPPQNQQAITGFLLAIETHFTAPLQTAFATAQTLAVQLNEDPNGRPSPARLRALRDYYANLEIRGNIQSERVVALQTLVDEYVVVAGFSEDVVALFRHRVAQAHQGIETAQEECGRIAGMVHDMEATPGLNARKVPLFSDAAGRAMKLQRVRAEAREPPFEYDLPLTPSNWIAAKSLGGGLSQACLWVDVDPATGDIRQRIVRKDTPVSRGEWADATKWYKLDMRRRKTSTKMRPRVPMEYHIQRALQDQPGAHYVAMALKCEVDVERLLYRLYLPYCPYGDLESLIDRYDRENMYLPEPLLWRIFGCLAETGMIMERGALIAGDDEDDDDATAVKGWMEIVHRDLKPANVFLDLASETTYPRYPTPRLADFGLAIQTWKEDPMNPTIYNRGGGTPGYFPPEQSSYMDIQTREPVDDFKLLAHTNVWGIGAIMWSLAHRQIIDDDLEYLADDTQERAVGDQRTAHLSPELLDAIQACMRFDPAQRITFAALHRDIRAFVASRAGDGGVGDYLDQARRGVQEEDGDFDVFELGGEGYQVGFAFEGPGRG